MRSPSATSCHAWTVMILPARSHACQRAEVRGLPLQSRGIDSDAGTDQLHRRLQLPVRLRILRVSPAIQADRRAHHAVLQIEAEELAALGLSPPDDAIPARRTSDVLDYVLVLIRPERMHVVVGFFAAQHRPSRGASLSLGIVPVLDP